MLNNFSSDPIFTPEQILENRGRVAIFIDGSNLFYAALQLGIEIDYTKLLVRLTAGSRLLRSFFYTGVDRTNEKQQGFLLWMRRNGYRVIAKDLVQLPDGSKKANLDVEIAVDMMALVGSYDTAVLVSGDGDLAYAVDAVSYRGVRVEVVSLRSMTSDSLINVADRYIDLESIQETIQKTNRPGIHPPHNNNSPGVYNSPVPNYVYRPLSGMSMLEENGEQPMSH
ncbi:MAG TPA: NYN domain-containing protein [Cyanobacteria bacterium UBA11149]|nr:NYN domain-containing protein [Cyanobacteria bacterium UBA11367]HBE60826.1 NYN domain-containing protein [Cyanobacteria bacterium UBA11366]HBK62732.1 NYN domain-containing protein [Cyanobacteria bacterium UBA11166]HBR74206.1 NYN domain-containing protein [Cyanobacteria bacterium UBA11159]HBS69926.1 NYN domain-containing protein [Cyanobacteria bacterium UBA11153]HBW90908.1 NYN domain-containing protein [Cyanobacteria bacterium UBA11149]HCA94167.1 NYN domain-containing protein [Cyanobacteria